MYKYILDILRKEIRVDVWVLISAIIIRPQFVMKTSIVQYPVHIPIDLKHVSAGHYVFPEQSWMIYIMPRKGSHSYWSLWSCSLLAQKKIVKSIATCQVPRALLIYPNKETTGGAAAVVGAIPWVHSQLLRSSARPIHLPHWSCWEGKWTHSPDYHPCSFPVLHHELPSAPIS